MVVYSERSTCIFSCQRVKNKEERKKRFSNNTEKFRLIDFACSA